MNVAHTRHRPTLRPTARSRRSGGYVLALFALLLVPLLLMAGLAVDVGYWYSRASDIQKAADAASLAGVVWLPDEAKAREVALDVARRNGFDDADANITVTVNPSTKSPRRLRVAIRDDRVGSFFYSNLGGDDIDLARNSFAEYVTPVPMGSPRNYFGTGRLITGNEELLYQSVNPFCTDKVQGDRHQSRHFGGTCSSALNSDYRTTGYEMYIDAVPSRNAPIEVRLYDARYNNAQLSTTVESGQNCTTTYTYTYPTSTTQGWTGPSSQTSTITITGPLQYQTRTSGTSTSWSTIQTLAEGQTFSRARNLLRYRGPTTTTPTTTCTPTYTTVNEAGIDMTLANSNAERYRYSLYAADDTPLDDSDNPLVCSRTFDRTTPFDGYEYLGSRRWNTLPRSDTDPRPCAIAPGDPSGRYILRVQNQGAGTGANASGANQYGVVARYVNAGGDGLCDGRTVAACPRVYGKDAISVYANTSAGTASFFLAEIGPEHAGKKLRLELWDPGEGGNYIQIMRPTGTNSWTPVPFEWKVDNGNPTTTNTLSVTNSQFNGKLVEITVDLTGYNPPGNNRWWQIRYNFTSGTVTDRTTWSARILGDPVHLVEEN